MTAQALETLQPELYNEYAMEVIKRFGEPVVKTKRDEELMEVSRRKIRRGVLLLNEESGYGLVRW